MRIALVGAELEENLALRYLWAALEGQGHQVVQLAFNAADEVERVAQELVQSQAALAGLSMVFTWRARQFAALADRARELGYTGHIVAGGHFAAFNAVQLLSEVPAIDSVAVGEGEEIVCALAANLNHLDRVSGLLWRGANSVVRNRPACKPPDLDRLAFPVRRTPPDEFLGFPITNLLSSRGCLHSCAFCSIAAWHRLSGGARLRLRSPAAVADEIATLYARGYRIFNFHDDNFVLPNPEQARERALALRDEIARRRLGKIAFAIKSRPDGVEESLFALLKSLGLFRVFLGVEAGTSDALSRLGRGHGSDHNVRALETLRKLDIHTCFNLLLFNPDSTLEDVAANLQFLRDHPHNPMNFCRTEVYAGTPLEARLRESGRLQGDYWGYDYEISDPRAQRAFEIAYPCFQERNYGVRSVHQYAMRVDFEYQLLAHFFADSPSLRSRVKRFVREANLNTCEHLSRILEKCAGKVEARTVGDLKAQVARDDDCFVDRADSLLREIHGAARAARRSRRWFQNAASAGLVAASVSLAANCGHAFSTETIPLRPERDAGGAPPPQVTPPPSAVDPAPVSPLAPEPDAGAIPGATQEETTGALRKQLPNSLVSYLARQVPEGQELEIELAIDKEGKITDAILRRAVLSQASERNLTRRLLRLRITNAELRGRRLYLVLSADELDAARARAPTHMSEMAPQPPPPPPPPPKPGKRTPSTYVNEYAPMPYIKEQRKWRP